ncbi:MAG: hypothetical protein HQK53_03480 [Oligoflexia bacterium]|nr:hypothetical protein [Oligoflexia bacterium]
MSLKKIYLYVLVVCFLNLICFNYYFAFAAAQADDDKKSNINSIGNTEVLTPMPIVFDKNSDNCKLWLLLSRLHFGKNAGDVAQFLLDTSQMVSYNSFQKNIEVLLVQFLDSIGNERFVVVTDPKKSSQWIYGLYRDRFTNKIFDVITNDQLEDYLAKNKDVSNVFRIDDGVYSGSQMLKFARTIQNAAEAQDRSILFHLVVPYFTDFGLARILTMQSTHFNTKVYHPITRMNSLADLLMELPLSKRKEMLHKLKKLYPPGPEDLDGIGNYNLLPLQYRNSNIPNNNYFQYLRSMANQFFEFKIPDGYSGIESFLRFNEIRGVSRQGKIQKIIGSRSNIPINFRCVPYIRPPYKLQKEKESTLEFDFIYERDCLPPIVEINSSHIMSENSKCTRYESDVKELLSQAKEIVEKIKLDIISGNDQRNILDTIGLKENSLDIDFSKINLLGH